MTVKLLNITDWQKADAAKLLNLPAPPVSKQSRQVRIMVNAGRKTRLDLMRPGHDSFHLWTGTGLETIEFFLVGEGRVSFQSAELPYADADGVVHDEEVDCHVFTVDGQQIARDFSHEEKFTQLLQRRTASEEFMRAMEIAVRSRDALIERQQGEVARLQSQLKAKEARNVRPQGEPEPAGRQPAPDGSQPGGAGAPEGGGGEPAAPAAGDGDGAGDGPRKRPKGAGGSTVPPAS